MADYRCKCNGCKHIDPNERSGYKWYCTWYRSYEDPDRVHECTHFESQDGGGSCFLTSACCSYKGLADNCAELMTLRNFRDTYLKATEEGSKLVEEYYRIAPGLVEQIDQSEKRDEIYGQIYARILDIMKLIENEEHGKAVEMYRDMVLNVSTQV